MKCFSMFTGVGGFELGLEDHELVGYSEIDKYSSMVMKKHFGGVKNYGDATKIRTEDLPEFDMLCGGFPCQAFSIAGKREGFKDTRGTLFFEIARILKAKRPKVVLLENVKGLLNHSQGRTFFTIIQTLWELGYDVEWVVLNSKFFGVPQNRERVFIIGSLRGESRPEILPIREDAEQVQRVPRETARCLDSNMAKGVTPEHYFEKKKRNLVCHSLYPRSSKTGKGGTGHLTKNDGSAYCVDTGNMQAVEQGQLRRLTPRECERLQGFPDGWTQYGKDEKGETVKISDTQRYKMMGNAVTVNVIKEINRRIS